MASNKSFLNTDEYKGVRDFYPEDKAIQNYIFNVWRKTMESFGYAEYDASVLESTEIYEAKSGEELIKEQTYTFLDRGGRSVTLRPEMTPTVARMVAKRRRELPYPLRLYSIPNLFRYERPQRGRLREHWQLNTDIFGVDSNEADIEILLVASSVMRNFGLKDDQFTIRISSRKLLNAIFTEWYELDDDRSIKMQRLIDKKSKMVESDFENKANEIVGDAFEFLSLSSEDETYGEAMALPMIRNAKEELDLIIDNLNQQGIRNVIYDPELIRGFDYYTGTVFEVFDNNTNNNRSLFGGGRYDGLVSLFGAENTSAFGFGMGDVTIKDVLETYDLVPKSAKRSKTKIYICPFSDSDLDSCKEMAAYFRTNNISVGVHITPRKVADEIKQAEKQNIEWLLVIGENETKNNTYKLKNLETREEIISTKEELINYLKR